MKKQFSALKNAFSLVNRILENAADQIRKADIRVF